LLNKIRYLRQENGELKHKIMKPANQSYQTSNPIANNAG